MGLETIGTIIGGAATATQAGASLAQPGPQKPAVSPFAPQMFQAPSPEPVPMLPAPQMPQQDLLAALSQLGQPRRF